MSEQPRRPRTPRVRFPLGLKLSVFAAVLLLASIVGVGLAALALTEDTVETSQRELQIAVLQDLAHGIESDFRHAQDDLDTVGRVLVDREVDEDARIDAAVAQVEGSEALDHVALYDRSGRLITPIVEDGAKALVIPETLAPELIEQARADNLAIGAAAVTTLGPRVGMVVPLHAGGEITGFAATALAIEPLQRRVEGLADTHFTDVPNGLFVVDRDRRAIAHPDRELADRLATLPATGVLDGGDRLALGRGLSRSGEYVDERGVAMVGTFVALEDHPWALVAQTTRAIAYAPVERLRNIVLVTVAAATVAAIVASVVLARRITSPLAQLSEYAGAIARRDFTSRIDVHTDDELAVLARAMNQAATDLQLGEQRLRQEAAIRADLGRYLSAELVDKVVRREQDMALGGERRPLTVMFADVVGFTPLTERLAPEKVVTLLNELFSIVSEIVFRHGGTIDKFVGDCVMALWGVPEAHPDHARRALAAAEEIMSWLEAGNAAWQGKFGVSLQLAIGINSGEAIVGNVGSERRMEYTAIGDVINVAARLEAIARPQQILTTAATRDLAGPQFRFVAIGPRPIAGRSEPLELFELVA